MGAQALSSRAIIGEFYRTLEQDTGAGWVDPVSMLFESDQDSEEYVWIGQSPAMREWVGGRHAKGFIGNGISVRNLHFEATIQFLLKELRRDKSPQTLIRIQELADRTNSHWASLLSTLIINGESSVCYDGQFFFDTDHVDPGAENQTAQSNDISVDVSALPAEVATGTPTDPSLGQFMLAIAKGITQIHSFKDDRGEPMNENARQFLVMVPTPLWITAGSAIAVDPAAGIEQRSFNLRGMRVDVQPNTRLTWTDKFAVFRTDGRVKPFIRQQETPVDLKVKAEGSDFEFDNDAHQYGVDAWRNVAYGYWQHATLVTMV